MEQLFKAVHKLLLINLIKHTTVYIVAHHWHNLTAVPKVPTLTLQNNHGSTKQSWLWQQQLLFLLHKRVFKYVHIVFLNIPEAYMRTILVLSHNKCMTWWNVLESSITCESRWRFRIYSALPWLEGGNEFTWHNRGIKKCREDLEKLYVHFNFLSPFRWFFCSLSYQSFFMKVTMNGKSAWLRGWGNTEKRWGTSVQNRPCK